MDREIPSGKVIIWVTCVPFHPLEFEISVFSLADLSLVREAKERVK